jgi:predicted RND superfamily exporter protein
MIAIGIAVDDTIHFLLRYRIESSRAVTVEGAITNTFQFTGRALVITTVILAVGFAPLGTSDYFAVRIIGTWLPATLLTALLADLYLTPALVRLGAIPFPANPDSSR